MLIEQPVTCKPLNQPFQGYFIFVACADPELEQVPPSEISFPHLDFTTPRHLRHVR